MAKREGIKPFRQTCGLPPSLSGTAKKVARELVLQKGKKANPSDAAYAAPPSLSGTAKKAAKDLALANGKLNIYKT